MASRWLPLNREPAPGPPGRLARSRIREARGRPREASWVWRRWLACSCCYLAIDIACRCAKDTFDASPRESPSRRNQRPSGPLLSERSVELRAPPPTPACDSERDCILTPRGDCPTAARPIHPGFHVLEAFRPAVARQTLRVLRNGFRLLAGGHPASGFRANQRFARGQGADEPGGWVPPRRLGGQNPLSSRGSADGGVRLGPTNVVPVQGDARRYGLRWLPVGLR